MIATYRLQLRPDFGFDDVRALLPFFERLGVSHLYLSPITEARLGSPHGYDVVDHNRIRQEYGGEEGFERLRAACVQAQLGLVLDFVPNHAGVGSRNEAWRDILAYGPYSPYARFFDIDWHPLKNELRNKLLLPFLGQPYGAALDGNEIRLVWERDRLFAAYFDHRFTLCPTSYAAILDRLLLDLERTDAYWDLKSACDAYKTVEPHEHDRAEALRQRVATLLDHDHVAQLLARYTHDELHELLEQQYWRLSYWKTASHEINYRRFFDVNELVALRMEDDDVFFAAHELLGRLVLQDGIDGIRIDHIDGLSDPRGYLARLRELGAKNIWVEKILAPGEIVPEDWSVTGTTGYEFLNDVTRTLIDGSAEHTVNRCYALHVGADQSYDDVRYRSKQLVMATMLPGELFRLAHELNRLSEADYHTRDFTFEALREALGSIIACFSRYRTYLPEGTDAAVPVIQAAIHEAQQRNPAFEQSVYLFIAQVLLEPIREDLEDDRRAWVRRLQQYTAPVAAKGVEDTAFYRYVRFVALNEVGGDPDRFAVGPEVFHAHARFRAHSYPQSLLATATHDHKRGEDLRMRLVALAEMPNEWYQTLRALGRAAQRHRGDHGPSRADLFLFAQMLIGLWWGSDPEALKPRLVDYMTKAVREAKEASSWLSPSEAYETDMTNFVRKMIDDRWVRRAIGGLARAVAESGFVNSLTQLVLKLTSPGVPDFYQGTELLDLSLVDPDNRRPVDMAQRAKMLDELQPLLHAPDSATLAHWAQTCDPRLKYYVMVQLLRFRRTHTDTFVGTYRPLESQGPAATSVLAFSLSNEHGQLVTIVPRLAAATPATDRAQTAVQMPQGGQWHDIISGHRLDTTGDQAAVVEIGSLPLNWAVLHQRN